MDDTCITEKEVPAIQRFHVYHDGQPTGFQATSFSQGLEAGVEAMKANPEWKVVEVRDLEAKEVSPGHVWRNPLENRLIKSKLTG